jgi:CBS domain-containing protein
MDLASLCTREVVGIDAAATLRQAAALMCEEHVGALVVTTTDQPPQVVGIVTDRDLAIDVLGRPGNPDDLQVGHVAKSPPLAVRGDTGIREAITAMEQAGVRRLLVVDPDGGVVGIVSSDDLLCAVSEELESLARALRANIQREEKQRKVITTAGPAVRPVFPSFGTAAVQ